MPSGFSSHYYWKHPPTSAHPPPWLVRGSCFFKVDKSPILSTITFRAATVKPNSSRKPATKKTSEIAEPGNGVCVPNMRQTCARANHLVVCSAGVLARWPCSSDTPPAAEVLIACRYSNSRPCQDLVSTVFSRIADPNLGYLQSGYSSLGCRHTVFCEIRAGIQKRTSNPKSLSCGSCSFYAFQIRQHELDHTGQEPL